MAYATAADIETAYGPNLLPIICDHDGNGAVDLDTVTKACTLASGIIDSYIATRYSLPLSSVPAFLQKSAIDIAVYCIANTADRLTNEMRLRYEDQIAHLKDIAAGKATLGFVDPDPTDGVPTPDAAAAGRAHSFRSARR